MIEQSILNYIIVAVAGLIVGSFLNSAIWRFDDLKTILKERSHCTKCKKDLAWYDLVPVLSYILLWGRCRYCKKEISIQYPLVEAGTALLFAALFWKIGAFSSFLLYFYLAISAIFIVIFVYDMLKLQISDFLVILASSLWIIYLAIAYFVLHYPLSEILSSVYGALALGGFLGALVFVSREKWMGAGDIGLGAILGALTGWPNVLVAGFSAFILGGLVGVVLMATKKKEMQSQVPFAPFLILGFYIALFWGDRILYWYLKGFM